MLQEFDIEIKDKKETKTLVADHLSRLEHLKGSTTIPINENFPDE